MDLFFIEDEESLEKYNGIWNKFSNSIKKELDCESIHKKISVKQNKVLRPEARIFTVMKYIK